MVERTDGAGSPRTLTQTNMKTQTTNSPRALRAFTLIELLVVMAVIAVLAAMIFPAAAAVKRNATFKRVRTQMDAIVSAIEQYKENVKVLPPENPVSPANPIHPSPELNTLYYELSGVTATGTAPNQQFQPLSGTGPTSEANLKTFLGNPATFGLVNVTRGSEDEAQSAKNCLSNIRPGQYLEVNPGVTVLGISDKGTLVLTGAAGNTINPWRYTSTRATNNVGSYDLWVDFSVGSKNYRICNWNDKPINLP